MVKIIQLFPHISGNHIYYFMRCVPKICPHPRNLFEDVSAETSVQTFPKGLGKCLCYKAVCVIIFRVQFVSFKPMSQRKCSLKVNIPFFLTRFFLYKMVCACRLESNTV